MTLNTYSWHYSWVVQPPRSSIASCLRLRLCIIVKFHRYKLVQFNLSQSRSISCLLHVKILSVLHSSLLNTCGMSLPSFNVVYRASSRILKDTQTYERFKPWPQTERLRLLVRQLPMMCYKLRIRRSAPDRKHRRMLQENIISQYEIDKVQPRNKLKSKHKNAATDKSACTGSSRTNPLPSPTNIWPLHLGTSSPQQKQNLNSAKKSTTVFSPLPSTDKTTYRHMLQENENMTTIENVTFPLVHDRKIGLESSSSQSQERYYHHCCRGTWRYHFTSFGPYVM